jgi:hypothetical protein
MSDIQKLAEELEFPVRSYSGRGMMGKSCLGIVADSNEMFSMFYLLGTRKLDYPWGSIHWDNFGAYNTIYYFPDVSFVERDVCEDPTDVEEGE